MHRSLTRTRYARVCLEIDLDKPLQRGFWLIFGDKKVFVVIQYERLPTFCYHCGVVGHGASACSRQHGRSQGEGSLSDLPGSRGVFHSEDTMPVMTERRQAMELDPSCSALAMQEEQQMESGFGPWMLVSRRRGRGRGRGREGTVLPRARQVVAETEMEQNFQSGRSSQHVEASKLMQTPRGGSRTRGRGGLVSQHPARAIPSPTSKGDVTGLRPQIAEREEIIMDNPTVGFPLIEWCTGEGSTRVSSQAVTDNVSHKEPNPNVQSRANSGQVRVARNAERKGFEVENPIVMMAPVLRQGDEGETHQSMVERVVEAIKPAKKSQDSADQPMTDSESSEEDSEMEDLADDQLTLGQFQDGVRKEALVRKGGITSSSSHKKGRVDDGGSNIIPSLTG